MAQIGLRHYKYSPMDKDGNYTGVNKMAGAIESKPSLNIATGELYADDRIVESVDEITKGSLSLVLDDDDDTIFAPLLGHKTTEDGEVLSSPDDIAPYVGFGQVLVKMVNGKRKYKAEFFPKVKFKPFVPEGKTKGENIEFQTPSVEGTIFVTDMVINNETVTVYERHKTFDTDKEAQDYLDNLMKKPTTEAN